MTRSLRSLIVVGAVATVAACSDVAPTAPAAVPAAAAARHVVATAAPVPSASCTFTPNGAGYDVTVSWSGFSPNRIELWQTGALQPLAQADLPHAHRTGSLTFTLQSAPDYARVTGTKAGFKVGCTTAP